MENITTELKLRIAYLEAKNRKKDEKYIDMLNDSDELVATLMVDVASYKLKLKKARNKLKEMYVQDKITDNDYINILEELND